MHTLLLVLLLLCLFYLLYINGFLIFSAKIAVSFRGYIRKNGECSFSFAMCNGIIKHVIKFKETKTYFMNFNSNISSGEFVMTLYDKYKNTLITCTENNYHMNIKLEKEKRYYLVFMFKNASGECNIQWI